MRIYANILAVRRSWVRKFRSKKDLFFQWSLKTKYSKTFCGPQMFYWFATNERTIVINEYIFWMFWVFFLFFRMLRAKIYYSHLQETLENMKMLHVKGFCLQASCGYTLDTYFMICSPKNCFIFRWKSTVFCIKIEKNAVRRISQRFMFGWHGSEKVECDALQSSTFF